jgi:uncharacterized protein (DUF1015 family)
MANIQPFLAIRPNSFYADQLVFTKPQTESVAGDYSKPGALKPLKTLLETGARLRPETPEGQMEAYQDIRDTLQNLLKNDQLWREQTPGIYVYEVIHKTYRQTGLWALTSLADYTGGNIKTHELTFSDSVRRIKNYRENTGLEGSPILVAYPPNVTINRIIAETKATNKKTTLGNPQGLHRLWKINDPEVQKQLIEAFSHIPNVYLADGHHRIESAAKLVEEQRLKRLPIYDTISSLYMATDQLRIREYDRVVLAEQPINKADLFKQINKNFYIQDAWGNKSVQRNEPHWIGMYIQEEWYHLLAKPHTYANKGAGASIDAAILQEYVLAPIFGINDPKTDPQLKCAGGEKAMEEMAVLFQSHPRAIAFTLSPLTVEQLIAVADAGEILPPKSTWIDPKIPYGLLLHQHQPVNKNSI